MIEIGAVLVSRQRPAAGRVDAAVDDDVGHVHAVLGILLGQHLRQGAHHDPRIVQRLPGHALLPAQRTRIVREEERALAFLAHRRQHFLGDEKRSAAGDVLRRVEHLHRDVFEQFLVRRQIAAFQVAGVVDQHVRVAGLAADRGERRAIESCETRSSSTIMHSPPCSRIAAASLAALASLRVVSTVKKPSCANFCAIAPPTPQRTPTGRSLSSTVWPCASKVLRPSDCHFEVAPTTTATCLALGVGCHTGISFFMQNAGFAIHDALGSIPADGRDPCGR